MYSINDVAVMTGLTTRTLRNYLNQDLLQGEKINGSWQFTAEQFCEFIRQPAVKAALQSKNRGQIFDFIADNRKPTNAACFVLDLVVDLAESNRVSAFFCEAVNAAEGVHFSYTFDKGHARVILTGPEKDVQSILAAYYEK